MRRLYATTKSFTKISFLVVLIGAVCYVSYLSTSIKGQVMQKQTNSKSKQVRSPQETKKDEILANVSKSPDQQNWKDEQVEGSTTIQKDLQLQSNGSNRTIKWQQAITREFFPTRKLIQNAVNTKNQRAEQESIKPAAVETEKQKENLDLFIAILSAPRRFDRRAVLRNTWISSIPNYSVAFRFFTDGKELSNEIKTKLSEEQNAFGDLEMLPTKGGYWFSHRFLHALFWAHHHYNFSYFLRLDDDYFVCLHHLYHDLQYRKKEKFLYWGWLWCQKEIVRIDEGFVLLGADLAEEIIRRNKSLYCHPFGDQMIEMWFSRLREEGINMKYFPDNGRLMQFGLRPYKPSQNMCQDLLGIHKTYPDQMRLYWNRTKDVWYSSPRSFKKIAIKDYASYCHIPRGLNWEAISGMYHHEPKPCWKPGVDWPILRSRKMHLGEEAKLKRPKPSEKLKPTTKKYTTGSPARIRI